MLLALGSNGLLTAILLAIQVAMLTWRGAINAAWPFYVALVALAAVSAALLFVLVALRIVVPQTAITLYAWLGLGIISGFIAADYAFERGSLPWGMFMLLPAGVAAVVVFGTLRATVPYAVAASLVACVTGCAYGQFGNTVAMLVVLVLVSSISLEMKRLREENENRQAEIEKLQEDNEKQDEYIGCVQRAIRTLTNGGEPGP